MKRSPSKKGIERRKKSRERTSTPNKQSSRTPQLPVDTCHYCAKSLAGDDTQALFVEEEVGRIFCTEACITAYFAPEIERLEKEYFRRLSADDLSVKEKEGLAHLRWITLQEPDEVWREKTLKGDFRYTLISEFKPGDKTIWSICITLFLRGEPSFLFLAFTTRNAAMVNHYRKGERVEWVRPTTEEGAERRAADEAPDAGDAEGVSGASESHLDRLADSWTEDETIRAAMLQRRAPDDISVKDFPRYESSMESTLEEQDEVWSTEFSVHSEPGSDEAAEASDDDEDEDVAPKTSRKLYQFIRYFPREAGGGYWYVIIARETEEEEQLEVMDAFPSRDPSLVERYRRGTQEVGKNQQARSTARMVH